MKRYDESVNAYQASLRLNPKQRDVHYNLGTLYAERERFQEARTELRAALDLDPGYAAAWSNLALVSERLQLDPEAIEAHEKAAALGEAKAQNYFRLGVLYAKANQPEPSIANFGKAIELEPEKYRQVLREELRKVHSVLDSVRYQEKFARLLTGPPPSPGKGP
jgi:tetratricopeptide (TPR) repeat protein